MKSKMILVDGTWYVVSHVDGETIFAMDEDGAEFEFTADDVEMES